MLTTCYNSMQSYLKIHLILTTSSKVRFLYQKSQSFWVADTELPTAGQGCFIVSTFSVILVDKYAAITTQKVSYVECFSFSQQRFVFAHLLQ